MSEPLLLELVCELFRFIPSVLVFSSGFVFSFAPGYRGRE